MTDAQDTQWVDEILEPFHRHNCHSRQAWVKGMTQPFPCDCDVSEAKAAILAHEDKDVAAGKLEVMKSDYEDIYHIHMAHDWNEMSDDTREWLMKRLHNIHRLQREQEGK